MSLENSSLPYHLVASENLARIVESIRPVQEAARISEDEIKAVIDEALAEVRSERKAMTNNPKPDRSPY